MNSRSPGFPLVRSAALLSSVFALWVLAPAVALAQNSNVNDRKYDQMPFDKTRAAFPVQPILTKGTFQSKEEEDAFRDYYNLYVLPHFTQGEFGLGLPTFRKKLRQELGKRVPTGDTQVHDKLAGLVLDFMEGLANNQNPADGHAADYAPVVRINAVLMIGDLNAQEVFLPGQKPTPLPAALEVLRKCVENPKQLEAVRVAAMVGILRHVALGISDTTDPRRLVKSMLDLLELKAATEGQAVGRAWVLAQAAEVVGLLGTPEENSKFAAGLAAIAGDAGASLDVRCTVARGMKALKLSDAKDPGVWAAALGQLALAAVKAENSPVDPERLKARLAGVLDGLAGAVVGTDKAHHSAAEDLKKAVVALRKAVDTHAQDTNSALADTLQEGREPIVAALRGLRK